MALSSELWKDKGTIDTLSARGKERQENWDSNGLLPKRNKY